VTSAPIYATPEPNAAVLLYEGPLELTQSERSAAGPGDVRLVWLPDPSVRFRIRTTAPAYLSDGKLRLVDRGVDLEVDVRHHGHDKSLQPACSSVGGHVGWERPSNVNAEAAAVVFHVPNFLDLPGPVTLEEAGFRVTIDHVPDGRELTEELSLVGGYALTHVGQIEVTDGGQLSPERAKSVLDGLHHLFAFAHGRWCSPTLFVALGSRGDRLWEWWTVPRITPWREGIHSTFGRQDRSALRNLFPGFWKLFSADDWGEPLVAQAVHSYVQANVSEVCDEALGIALAGLELLAWVWLVEVDAKVSKEGFDRLPASDRLRLLLSFANLPLEIPSQLADLREAARKTKWVDGPHAITELRNGVVHPARRDRTFQTPGNARIQAWELSLYYLELLILRLCGYGGTHSNRFNFGASSPVPWAK
jgi:hypothetical protein